MKTPIQQNNNMEIFTEKQVYELMIKAFNAGFNKYESVEAGLEGKETDLECANILTKYIKSKLENIQNEKTRNYFSFFAHRFFG